MRLKSADLVLLTNIYNKLLYLKEIEQAEQLNTLIARLKHNQKIEREKCRCRAAENRKAGYAWKSSHHPKKSKYLDNENTNVIKTVDDAPPDKGYYDEVGGYHDEAMGYSPSGNFCGECTNESCADCSVYAAEKEEK